MRATILPVGGPRLGPLRGYESGVYISDLYLSDDSDETPTNLVENVFDELEGLKSSQLDPYSLTHELQEEILKDVFDPRVEQMLEMEENRERLRVLFEEFDFNLNYSK